MATTKLVVSAMYSGQGMCNVVEAYDGGTLQKLMLVDFGAEKDSTTARLYTLPALKEKIEDHGKIDVMVISHSDRDHWNLMKELLDELDDDIEIEIAAFGIGAWFNSALAFQNAVKKRLKDGKYGSKPGLKYFYTATSDIKADSIDYWDIGWGDVTFNILAASVNQATADASKPYKSTTAEPNTASIVLRCKFAGQYCILTGDATWATLKFINKKMNGSTYGGTGFMVTAPHHGALATLEYRLDDLKLFMKACKPIAALASAQLRSGFNHPNVCVMCTMSEYVTKTFGDHPVVLNFPGTDLCSTDPIFQVIDNLDAENARQGYQWYKVDTDYNMFTTAIAGNIGVNWIFTTAANGTKTITRSDLAYDVDLEMVIPTPPFRSRDESEFYVGVPPAAAVPPPPPAAIADEAMLPMRVLPDAEPPR